jgi:hypothetical protein
MLVNKEAGLSDSAYTTPENQDHKATMLKSSQTCALKQTSQSKEATEITCLPETPAFEIQC